MSLIKFNPYQTRPIRFLEIYRFDDWQIKVYSISVYNPLVSHENIKMAKDQIESWLLQSKMHNLPTYNIATLILHEGREGCFAIINWWVDENMLQNFVYLKKHGETGFTLFSDSGISTCVWEMAVWWHERNIWVKHVLMQNENPDFEAYLNDQLNTDL